VVNKKVLSLALLGLLLSFQVMGDPPCDDPLLSPAQYGAQARAKVVDVLKASNIPSFLKATKNGTIPVILLNNGTLSGMSDLLNGSVGTHVFYQPDWNNDHGGMRFAQWLADVDTPGARGYGEINRTGIAWKQLPSYLARRQAGAYVAIEVAYSLTPEEKVAVEYYQRMRRAAIIRVPFTFGGNNADMTLPNTLLNGGEHCFIFCKASQVSTHIAEIDRNLQKMVGASGAALMQNEEVKVFLKAAREKILAVDPRELNPGITQSMQPQNTMEDIFPKGMSAADRLIAMNWMIGYDASRQYQALMRSLNVSGDTGYRDMNNERASFVLIYDSPNSANAFRDATYTTQGKFSTWGKDGQTVIK
jgi:hypothetical protein